MEFPRQTLTFRNIILSVSNNIPNKNSSVLSRKIPTTIPNLSKPNTPANHSTFAMAFSKLQHRQITSPRQKKTKRQRTKAFEEEQEYTEDWYDFDFNPETDGHGKAKKHLLRKRNHKREFADEVEYLSQTGPKDEE